MSQKNYWINEIIKKLYNLHHKIQQKYLTSVFFFYWFYSRKRRQKLNTFAVFYDVGYIIFLLFH